MQTSSDKFRGYDDVATALQCSRIDAQSNAVNISYPSPASYQSFIHENVLSVIPDAIVKLPTQFVLSYVPSSPESERVIPKPCVGQTRHLLGPEHQIDIATLLSTFSTPGATEIIFLTPFLHCTTAATAHLKVFTSQARSHNAVPLV